MDQQPKSQKPIVHIPMTAVESSQLKAIGYDPATHTLQVDFNENRGAIYQYHDVPQTMYDEFLASDSKGSFFYKRVKDRVAFTRFDRESGAFQKTWEPEPAEQAA